MSRRSRRQVVRIFNNAQWNIVTIIPDLGLLRAALHPERADDAAARGIEPDHFVDIAAEVLLPNI